MLAMFCFCTFKVSNSFLPNCQFLFCQATQFCSAKQYIFVRTPMRQTTYLFPSYLAWSRQACWMMLAQYSSRCFHKLEEVLSYPGRSEND